MAYVLVVDDDPADRWVLCEALDLEGHEVAEAANGAEAIDKLEEGLPDLILLDIMMPRMDGWKFLDELRGRGYREHVRVVMVTALNDAETVGRTSREGVAHIGKPFDLQELLDKVNAALSLSPHELLLSRGRMGDLARLLTRLDAL